MIYYATTTRFGISLNDNPDCDGDNKIATFLEEEHEHRD